MPMYGQVIYKICMLDGNVLPKVTIIAVILILSFCCRYTLGKKYGNIKKYFPQSYNVWYEIIDLRKTKVMIQTSIERSSVLLERNKVLWTP